MKQVYRKSDANFGTASEKPTRSLKRINKKQFRGLAVVLSLLVVVGTFHALSLPGVTMEKTLLCETPEHTHTEECFAPQETLICTAQTETHTHTDACTATQTTLVCAEAESETHAHTEKCYQTENPLICTLKEQPEHIHDADCNLRLQTCELPEHTHTEECYAVQDDGVVEAQAVLNDQAGEQQDTAQTVQLEQQTITAVIYSNADDAAAAHAQRTQAWRQASEPATSEPDASEPTTSELDANESETAQTPIAPATTEAFIQIDGQLPVGAYALAYPVQLEQFELGENTTPLVAFDITIYLPDGTKWQPETPVSVTIQAPELTAAEHAAVYHVPDTQDGIQAEPELTQTAVEVQQNQLTFTADSFSVYLVAQTFTQSVVPSKWLVENTTKSETGTQVFYADTTLKTLQKADGTSAGGAYSIHYALNNFNHFVLEDSIAGHTVGAIAVGGDGNYPYIGIAAFNYENTTPSYIKGSYLSREKASTLSAWTSAVDTTFLGTVNLTNPKVLGGTAPGQYSQNSTINVYFNDNYIDFEEAFAELQEEAEILANASDKVVVDRAVVQSFIDGTDLTYTDPNGAFSLNKNGGAVIKLNNQTTYDLTNVMDLIKFISYSRDGTEGVIDVTIVSMAQTIQLPEFLINGQSTSLGEYSKGFGAAMIFPNATTVTGAKGSHLGHLVAPNADVIIPAGDVNGSFIAKSLKVYNIENNLYGESHMHPYNGKAIRNVSAQIFASKTLNGQVPNKFNTFTFNLEQWNTADGWQTLQTVENNGAEIGFRALKYQNAEESDVFYYRVTEIAEEGSRYQFDTSVYLVKVEIVAGVADALSATTTYYKLTDTTALDTDQAIQTAIQNHGNETLPSEAAFENTLPSTPIKLYKVNVDGTPITSDTASFTVYQLATDGTQTPLQTLDTNESGWLEFVNLEPGNYCIRETKTPSGYIGLSGAIYLQIAADGTATLNTAKSDSAVTKVTSEEENAFALNVKNTSFSTEPGTVAARKLWKDKSGDLTAPPTEASSGVQVLLYRQEGTVRGNTATIQLLDKDGNLVEELVYIADENGNVKVKLEARLGPAGDYSNTFICMNSSLEGSKKTLIGSIPWNHSNLREGGAYYSFNFDTQITGNDVYTIQIIKYDWKNDAVELPYSWLLNSGTLHPYDSSALTINVTGPVLIEGTEAAGNLVWTKSAQGDDLYTPVDGETATLNATNNWMHTWNELPLKSEDGTVYYRYLVKEEELADYTTTYQSGTYSEENTSVANFDDLDGITEGIITVINKQTTEIKEGFELPNTGGMGINPRIAMGITLLGAAGVWATQKGKKRKRE